MNLHKLLRQFAEQHNAEDVEAFRCLLGSLREAKKEFENVEAEFTFEKFKKWYNKTNPLDPANPYQDEVKAHKIVDGDNLDLIEEAAEKKGLV